MNQATKRFHLGTLLSVATGVFLAPGGPEELYKILDFMEGHDHFTHELGYASERCAPALLAQFPWLAEINLRDNVERTEDEWWALLATLVMKYGEWHDVKPSRLERSRSPIDTLKDMLRPDQVILQVPLSSAGDAEGHT